jgi:cAMP phosphodiesterase
MKVRVLGCSGAIAQGCRTTSFLIEGRVLIDAGTGVGDLTLEEMRQIDHVLLTHSHLDHVAALPLMLDAVSSLRGAPVQVHALPATIAALRQHVFNNVIWPDFEAIPTVDQPFLRLHPLQTGDQRTVAGRVIEALPAVHLSPRTLLAELQACTALYCPVYITHTKPAETQVIMQEIHSLLAADAAHKARLDIRWLQAGEELIV